MADAPAREMSSNSLSRSSSPDESQKGASISSEGTHPDAKHELDPLAEAFNSLFLNVATVVQSQLQCNTESLELLERMNLRTADEYNEFADFAAGLRIFVERLKLKNDSVEQFGQQIDAIEHELLELEGTVSLLNSHTSALEAKIRKAHNEGLMD